MTLADDCRLDPAEGRCEDCGARDYIDDHADDCPTWTEDEEGGDE